LMLVVGDGEVLHSCAVRIDRETWPKHIIRRAFAEGSYART
jgi:hypothetical protein